jgi:hypothetical protein
MRTHTSTHNCSCTIYFCGSLEDYTNEEKALAIDFKLDELLLIDELSICLVCSAHAAVYCGVILNLAIKF